MEKNNRPTYFCVHDHAHRTLAAMQVCEDGRSGAATGSRLTADPKAVALVEGVALRKSTAPITKDDGSRRRASDGEAVDIAPGHGHVGTIEVTDRG